MAAVRKEWSRYFVTWIALVALAVLSLGLSSLRLGAAYLWISMLIAAVMALIALVFFMHLDEERFSIILVPAAVIFFIALLVSLVALDVASRTTFPRGPAPSMGEPPAE